MPLGAGKFRIRGKYLTGQTEPVANAEFAIATTLSDDYLANAGYTNPTTVDPYQTVTFDITSNRPNATLEYTLTGNVTVDDFANTTSLTGNITTDANGNASVLKTVSSNVSLGDGIDFQLKIIRSNVTLAQSTVCRIYNVAFPEITVSGNSVLSVTRTDNNLYFDGNVITINENANLTITSLGSIASNAFQKLIGVDSDGYGNSLYYGKPLPIMLVGAGGGGPTNVGAGGGAGGEVKYLEQPNVSVLNETTYSVVIGQGVDASKGGNTTVFTGTGIEISAEGGNAAIGGTGGSIGEYLGGSRAPTVSAGGGGASKMVFYSAFRPDPLDTGLNGQDGRTLGGGSAYGGNGASSTPIIHREYPFYSGVDPTDNYWFGMGGGAGAYSSSGATENAGECGEPGVFDAGRGGTSTTQPSDGRANTGMGGGGWGYGAGSTPTKGGSGVVYIRVPVGPNFRFISTTEY